MGEGRLEKTPLVIEIIISRHFGSLFGNLLGAFTMREKLAASLLVLLAFTGKMKS
jgi:hypothetical protein